MILFNVFLTGHQIQNKRLGVAFARAYDKDTLKNTNLYVSSIPSSHISEEAITELFSQYGKIINVKVRHQTDLLKTFKLSKSFNI